MYSSAPKVKVKPMSSTAERLLSVDEPLVKMLVVVVKGIHLVESVPVEKV